MSLTSKAQQYDVLVKELFELLERTEETDWESIDWIIK